MKVLIADDNATNRKLLRVVLEAEGADVCEACDGIEALAILRIVNVDVVISDVMMPNQDGYELCHSLRIAEKRHAMPFIFYTNTYTSASSEKFAYESGADSFIKKPATAEFIVAAVKKIVESRLRGEPGGTTENYPGKLKLADQDSTRLFGRMEQQKHEHEEANERLLKINHALLARNKALEHANSELLRMNEGLEARIGARTQDLEDSSRELEALSADVSQDLLRPLTAIRTGCGVLQEDLLAQLSPESLGILTQIDRSAERISRIASSLLSLSQVSLRELTRETIDLTACAAEIVRELNQETPRKVDCRIAPALMANGDRELVRILMRNLLGNAWTYTGRKDTPVIEVGVLSTSGESGPTFFIRDNGVGFETNEAPMLLQPFHRLKRTEDHPGTGVGLTTALHIVRRHGGRLWADGRLNEGAVFYFTLGAASTEPV